MKAKITRRVLGSVLLTALLLSGLGLYAVYATARQHAVETHPLALRWSGESLRARLEQAGAELERVARNAGLQTWVAGLAARPGKRAAVPIEILKGALAQSVTFEGLLVLDTEGEVLAALGSGSGLAGVRELLRPKSSLEAELVEVMQAARLRAELGGVETTSLRVVDPAEVPPLPLASVPLRSARGRPLVSLHGLVRREALASGLRADLVGHGGNVLLVDPSGRIVADGRETGGGPAERLPEALYQDAGAAEPRAILTARRGWIMACARPAEAFGWTLVAEQPLHEVFRPLLPASLGFLVTGLALVLLCTLAASWAARRLVRPLWDLLQGLREAARGDGFGEISVGHAQAEGEALVAAFNAMVHRLGAKHREIETSHRALREQHEAFQHQYQAVSKLSITDGLTQVPNRRFFDVQLQREVKRLSRTGQGLVLLILDIDDFKRLNDRYGHAAGDEFLKQIAGILKEIVRETDLLARFGGEEFVVVATGTTLDGAVILAEKIRTAVAEASFIVDDTMRPRKATISIGAAEFRGSRTDLFNAADAALYRAKAAGKNCVMVAGDEESDGGGSEG
jgi:diguanylate cyclase (GGDEF)-like protein